MCPAALPLETDEDRGLKDSLASDDSAVTDLSPKTDSSPKTETKTDLSPSTPGNSSSPQPKKGTLIDISTASTVNLAFINSGLTHQAAVVRQEPTRDSDIRCTFREIFNQGEVIKSGEERKNRTPTIKQSERTKACVLSIPEHSRLLPGFRNHKDVCSNLV